MKFQLRYIDLVTIVALIFGGLALILVLVQISYTLNQPSQTQQSSTQQDTQLQALQDHISSLASIQAEVNKSLMNIEAQWQKSSAEITAESQVQHDAIERELQAIKLYKDSSSQEINTLKLEQTNLSQGIEFYKSEVQNVAGSLQNTINGELSTLRENVSTNMIELNKLAENIGNFNETIQMLTGNSCQKGTLADPASSCREICQGSTSGNYWIQTSSTSSPVQVYCDMNPRSCSCGFSTGGWMRAANFDMTDSTQQCPEGFQLISRFSSPRRTCGRPTGASDCVSTTFPVHGTEYSRVCGRIVAYQVGTPSGFDFGTNDINDQYLAGISLTHGESRQHIWSFVNGKGEGSSSESCPCFQGSTSSAPSFIGNDYFCDTAIRGSSASNGVFYPSDPLWDGQGCGSRSTCCTFSNPPWFCKRLPQPTTDDIEMRLCENSPPNDDDSPFEMVELYIN